MPPSLTDDIQQIWWLYGWSDDRSFGWSVGWWVSCPENGNDSEPIIGHLSGISESLADFLNWKMQIFEGALLCPLFLEVQTVGRENWKELKRAENTKSKSGQQPWNWILRFIAKRNAAVACQMCRSGMPQEEPHRNGNRCLGRFCGWAWLTFCTEPLRFRICLATTILRFCHCALVMLKKRSSIYFN